MRAGAIRKPDQCGGRGTLPTAYLAANLAIRFSSSKRPSRGRDWSLAQAPIWLSCGRDGEVGIGLRLADRLTAPSTRTCRRSDFQWNSKRGLGVGQQLAPLRLSKLV